jgi:hypothetical protein
MQRRNQAQRRREQAQKQRDQAKKKRDQAEQRQEPDQTAKAQETQAEQQHGQAQGARQQQGQAQQQEVPRFEISGKISNLPFTLQDLREHNLISEQESQEMVKVHAYSQTTPQQDLLASVLERIQAFINDAHKPWKQRRQIKRAKEVIQYHLDMQTRNRAHNQAGQGGAAQQQAHQAQAAQQQPRQAENTPQQSHPVRAVQQPAQRPRQAQPARQQHGRTIPESSRLIIKDLKRQSELSEQQFQDFRSSLSMEALNQWMSCVERSGQLLPQIYQGSREAGQEIEDMAPILLQPLRYIRRQQRYRAQPASTRAA